MRMEADVCTYCCAAVPEPESEHVFPESWYPDGVTPSQMLLVPSCPACNDRYDKLEQRVRGRLALILTGATDVDAAGVADRVQRSVDPSKAKNHRDARHRAGRKAQLRRDLRVISRAEWGRAFMPSNQDTPSWVQHPGNGLWQFGFPSVKFNIDGLNQLTDKFTRGVFRALHRKVLPRGTPVESRTMTNRKALQAAMKMIGDLELRGYGAPGFKAWHARGVADLTTVTLFLIWGRIMLCGITGQVDTKRTE